MSISFLRRVYFVSQTNTQTNVVNVGAACVNRSTATKVLRENYHALMLNLKKFPLTTIDFCQCDKDGFVVCVKGGPTYYGQVHKLDLQHPLNFTKREGETKNNEE